MPANRQLLLLRHAKAVIGGHDMEDAARPLAERGERAAQAMGRWLADHDLAPDLVLCSPACRTRQTWEIASRQLPVAETRFLDELYDFGDGAALLRALRAQGGAARRVLLVTHNPATQGLALSLPGQGERALLQQIAAKYPTAALTVMTLPGPDWSATADGAARLEAFIRPRDIMSG